MEEISKLVKVTSRGLKIIDEDLMERVKNRKMSPSMVNAFFQCPADWLMDKYILPKIESDEVLHMVRGNLFHKTMELVFEVDSKERTYQTLKDCANKVLNTEYAHLKGDEESLSWFRGALVQFVKSNPNWKDEVVARVPYKKELEKLGLELKVSGKLADIDREISGLVDKVIVDNNGDLVMVDYKTSKKHTPFSPMLPISESNDFSYWRQQITYALLLKNMGIDVQRAILIYPITGTKEVIDISNIKFQEQVIDDYRKLDSQLNLCIENNLFPFKAHHYCVWCGALHPKIRSRKKLNVNKLELVQYVEWE